MKTFDVVEVAGDLEWLVSLLENGEEREIVILREGRPAARLVPGLPDSSRVGVPGEEQGDR